MAKPRSSRALSRTALILALFLSLVGFLGCNPNLALLETPSAASAVGPATLIAVGPATLRGAWVQGKSITSRAKIDELLDRAAAGHLNALFVGVFGDGYTVFPSAFTDQNKKVEPDFDPLAYLVPEAHRRNIQVHAWFAVGRIGNAKESPVLARHPEWGMEGPDGKMIAWLNFTRPDARNFISDLMIDVIERYGVDGVHFDYTRYPDSEWGFDSYSVEAFTKQYGYDLEDLRYSELPAYGPFESNPLGVPSSARVLATFANGAPAVTLNAYGKGEVIVLNWQAADRTVAVGTEILQRGLRRLLGPDGRVYILRSETNIAEYGEDGFSTSKQWLQDLGRDPLAVGENGVRELNLDSVLVVPNVYLITPQTAGDMADWVNRGGRMIFIDGPTRSITLPDLQAITGLTRRLRHFKEPTLMLAGEESSLIPTSQRSADISIYRSRDAEWKEFRKQGVSALIQEVYQRVKAKSPETLVSVTITSDQEQAAQRSLQDWQAWMESGYVDVLIPRAYAKDMSTLAATLNEWKPFAQKYDRLTFAIIAYVEDGKTAVPKPPVQLEEEIKRVEDANSKGIMIFDLDRMSDEQLRALSNGIFTP